MTEERELIIQKIKDNEFEEVGYAGTGTTAFYDAENDLYYNHWGQQLRNPQEYNPHSEGYTPFGDE